MFALFNKANILSNSGEYAKALDAYLEYLEYENESSEAMTYAAECYDKTGDSEMASKYYKDAIDLDPGFAEPWFGLGVIFLNNRMSEETLYYFRKATELDPDNPEYFYFLGKSQAQFMRVKEAVRSFMIALRLDPFYDIVWNDLGILVITEGLYFRVIPLLERALKVTGDVHGLRFILAASYLY